MSRTKFLAVHDTTQPTHGWDRETPESVFLMKKVNLSQIHILLFCLCKQGGCQISLEMCTFIEKKEVRSAYLLIVLCVQLVWHDFLFMQLQHGCRNKDILEFMSPVKLQCFLTSGILCSLLCASMHVLPKKIWSKSGDNKRDLFPCVTC